MGFKDLLVYMREMKHYLIAATATFLLGIYLGYMESDSFGFFLNHQTDRLQGIVEGINRLGNPQLWLLAFIFVNNLLVSMFMVYAGAIFGLLPLFALLSNGLLLGYLAHASVPENGWGTLLLGILPHGIIEIPAFILACAYGIKLGVIATKSLLFLPFPSKRAANGQRFIRFLKVSLPLSLLMAGLLLTAAVIESFITYALLH